MLNPWLIPRCEEEITRIRKKAGTDSDPAALAKHCGSEPPSYAGGRPEKKFYELECLERHRRPFVVLQGSREIEEQRETWTTLQRCSGYRGLYYLDTPQGEPSLILLDVAEPGALVDALIWQDHILEPPRIDIKGVGKKIVEELLQGRERGEIEKYYRDAAQQGDIGADKIYQRFDENYAKAKAWLDRKREGYQDQLLTGILGYAGERAGEEDITPEFAQLRLEMKETSKRLDSLLAKVQAIPSITLLPLLPLEQIHAGTHPST